MSAQLIGREAVFPKVSACLAILGHNVADDAFLPIWTRADRVTRKLFLKVAGRPESWASMGWEQFRQTDRIEIRTRVEKLRDWLSEVLPAGGVSGG